MPNERATISLDLQSEYQKAFDYGLRLCDFIPNLRENQAAYWWYVYFALRGRTISPERAIAFADRIWHLSLDAGLVVKAIQSGVSSEATLDEIRGETPLDDIRLHMALLALQRLGLLEIEGEAPALRYAIKAPGWG